MMKILIYGGKGYIGSQFVAYLKNISEISLILSTIRFPDEDFINEINNIKPDRILVVLGKVRSNKINNIDCLLDDNELSKGLTSNFNVPINLAVVAKKYNIHMTYIGTGCIYNNSDIFFNETMEPNYTDTPYSLMKTLTDTLLRKFFDKEVLNCRIRLPISNNKSPYNFLNKLLTYKTINSIRNSITILDDFIPIISDMMINKIYGTFNCVNPGFITHKEIIEIYDKSLINNYNFTTITYPNRCNNILDWHKIVNLYPNIRSVQDSLQHMFHDKLIQ